jgi:SAM-dependent methyltransferase
MPARRSREEPVTQPDWSLGSYEPTAAELLPAAEQVVSAAQLRTGEHVLDVGCGTGNVALLAARAGARVVAVDPAPRLREVARSAADREGLSLDIRAGGAPGLPVDDMTQDAVLSSFAVIFSPDPPAAVVDLVRVLRPGGRVVLSAWVPGSAVDRMIGVGMRMLSQATGQSQPPRFSWHNQHAVAQLFAATGHGLEVRAQEHTLAYRASSPEAWFEGVQAVHPMAVMALQRLAAAGADTTAARQAMLNVLVEGNEDPSAFQVTSRYLVYTAR